MAVNRPRLLSLVWALFGATQLYWAWVRSVDYTDVQGALYVLCLGLAMAGGLAGVVDPDQFMPDDISDWLLASQVLALAGTVVFGYLMWG